MRTCLFIFVFINADYSIDDEERLRLFKLFNLYNSRFGGHISVIRKINTIYTSQRFSIFKFWKMASPKRRYCSRVWCGRVMEKGKTEKEAD